MSKITSIRLTVAALVLAFGAGCYDKGAGSGGTTYNVPLQENPIYDSGDLGNITVLGASVDAKARFTFNADEQPMSVHVEADYVPAAGNTTGAVAELWLYDTKADQDPTNDVLIGSLPPSTPWGRGRLDIALPGSFSVMCPIGAGTSEKIGPQVETLGVKVHISTTGWYGTVLSLRIRIVTMKGVVERLATPSFHRDQ